MAVSMFRCRFQFHTLIQSLMPCNANFVACKTKIAIDFRVVFVDSFGFLLPLFSHFLYLFPSLSLSITHLYFCPCLSVSLISNVHAFNWFEITHAEERVCCVLACQLNSWQFREDNSITKRATVTTITTITIKQGMAEWVRLVVMFFFLALILIVPFTSIHTKEKKK